MTTARLLALFAHPDDESFGPGATLARYAHTGAEVHVCTVTDGAAGVQEEAACDGAGETSLAAVRQQELACACRVLGASLHLLGYRDSGMEGSPDNRHPRSLYQAPLDEAAQRVWDTIQDIRPHVIITHDPTGGYFHPDHIKVNHAMQRALACHRDGDGWQPQRVYYTVIPASSVRWFLIALRLRGQDPSHFGANRDIDLTQVGVPDSQVHVRLDVRRYVGLKEEASACHCSQGGDRHRSRLPAWLRDYLARHETFAQAFPAGAGRHHDLLAGIALA